MLEVCEVVAIEPVQEVEFSDHSIHRLQQVWCKSTDEETQGAWTTFVKLYDNSIEANAKLKVGDMVGLEITPTSRRTRDNNVVQSIIIKLKVGAA